ncbi:hypothetical protein MKX03_022983 [Papaver bracteatum]|nr:hypothetical protein MKX03_022983 [Papaver bracteatum]
MLLFSYLTFLFILKVCLKWVYQQGVSVLVKSFIEERMEENLSLFDWELNEYELKKISGILQRRGLPGDVFVSANAPFQAVQDLWDAEV